MTQHLPPSRSSFDQSSLQEVINRYGWAKNPAPDGGQSRSPAPGKVSPDPLSSEGAGVKSPHVAAGKPSSLLSNPAGDAKVKDELSTARKKIDELMATLAEKEGQLEIVSRQCEELKERGDDFEKSAFKENGELLKLKSALSENKGLLQKAEDKIKELEDKSRKESDVLLSRIGELSAQLTLEGGGSVQEAVAKYKNQAKQGADLLKQSMAEVQRLELEQKNAQLRFTELEQAKNLLMDQLARGESESKSSVLSGEKILQLEMQVQDLEKRLQEAEAHASNSQAAVSHAMDFAYQATQDNELMKKKLHEAGIRT